jgi:DNA-binding Lrp family transcriptional regulator
MNCDLGSEKNVISSLKEVEDVKEAHGTFGLYDIILKIASEEKITKIVTQIIRKIPKICLI